MAKFKKLRKEFLEAMGKTKFIEHACKVVGISRNTFYTWIIKDPAFKREIEIAVYNSRQSMCDFGESKLLEAVDKGNVPAIKYLLSNNHYNYMKSGGSFTMSWGTFPMPKVEKSTYGYNNKSNFQKKSETKSVKDFLDEVDGYLDNGKKKK